jgi:hypothetical protein
MIAMAFYIAGLIILVTIILAILVAAIPVVMHVPFLVSRKWRSIAVPERKQQPQKVTKANDNNLSRDILIAGITVGTFLVLLFVFR